MMRDLIATVSLSSLVLVASSRAPCQAEIATRLLGCWEAGAGKERVVLRFTADRCCQREGSSFVGYLARIESDRVVLNAHGHEFTWLVAFDGERLKLRRGKSAKPQVFEKLAKAPKSFDPAPAKLGRTKKLKRRTMKKIRSELLKRARKDQQARNSSSTNAKKLAALDKANTAFLMKTVRKHGWIDIARFGEDGADAAWTLVIHSGSLPLMLAAKNAMARLPAEMKLRNGHNFASLVDRIAMNLGHKQVYGTQTVQDARGRHLVFPILDPAKIDERRKKLGMSTFEESLKVQAKWMGSKPTVQPGW